MPKHALTDAEIERYAKILNVRHFRGVYMRNGLPRKKPRKNESAVVNLDDRNGPGTHWVAYKKVGKNVQYFDSFGNLQPPRELIDYLKGCNIVYNYERRQKFNSVLCGHHCLFFLLKS